MWQKLQTNYDFIEANKATQKAINQVKDTEKDNTQDLDDDWGAEQGSKGQVSKVNL